MGSQLFSRSSSSLLQTYLVYRLLVLQFFVTTGLATVAFLLDSKQAAFSAICGGGCVLIYTVSTALLCFRHRGAKAAKGMIASLWIGQLVKLLTIAVFFGLALRFDGISEPVWLLLGFVAVQLTYWFSWNFVSKKT